MARNLPLQDVTRPQDSLLEGLRVSFEQLPVGVWVMINVLMAVIVNAAPQFATVHAFGTLFVGIFLIATKAPAIYILYIIAYIAGAEVFWRMNEARVFWEFGKYAAVALAVFYFLQHRMKRITPLPLLFFLLLVPSTIFSLLSGEPRAVPDVSQFMSGPLSLAVFAIYCDNLRLPYRKTRGIWIMIIGAAALVCTSALLGILQNPNIVWTTDSNTDAAGGYGANQVSAAISLGVIAAGFLLFNFKLNRLDFWVLIGLSVWMMLQAMITFSRGGVFGAVVTLALIIFLQVSDPRRRMRMIFVTIVGAVVIIFGLFPQLDAITGGKLAIRMTDTDLSNRDRIMLSELRAFEAHPIAGIGAGRGRYYRRLVEGDALAIITHTEYTRMLAEHGIPGALAIVVMFAMGARNVIRYRKVAVFRAMVIALLFWAFFYMTHSATRTFAPAFAIGLTFLTFIPDEETATVPIADTTTGNDPPGGQSAALTL